jgi:hypothetical protein
MLYHARKLKEVKNPGYMSGERIGVFRGYEQVGEFKRNYPSYGVDTFKAFERDGQWYALYSRSYVALSVMKLPECIHLGGEDESDGYGFCPVEVYIPRYQFWNIPAVPKEELYKYPECNHSWISVDREEKEFDMDLWEPNKYTYYEDFAFAAGCVWGDDSSWKIEIKDISRAHEGIINPIDKGLYYELPRNYHSLKDCLRLSAFNRKVGETRDAINIEITTVKTARFCRDSKDSEPTLKYFD